MSVTSPVSVTLIDAVMTTKEEGLSPMTIVYR